MSKSKYVPKDEEKGYVHVLVTEEDGEPLSKPIVKQFYPNLWPTIQKQPGFVGEVIWDAEIQANHEEEQRQKAIEQEKANAALAAKKATEEGAKRKAKEAAEATKRAQADAKKGQVSADLSATTGTGPNETGDPNAAMSQTPPENVPSAKEVQDVAKENKND